MFDRDEGAASGSRFAIAGLVLAVIVGAVASGASIGGDRVRAALAGVPPWATIGATGPRSAFVYPSSPLTGAEAAQADRVADDVGAWLIAHTGLADTRLAAVALWGQAEEGEVVLRARDALEPLDADGRALVLAHVAWRLDVDLRLAEGADHLVVVLPDPEHRKGRDLAIDPTTLHRLGAAPATLLDADTLADVVLARAASGAAVDEVIERLSPRGTASGSARLVRALHAALVTRADAALDDDVAAARRDADQAVAVADAHPQLELQRADLVLQADAAFRQGDDATGRAAIDRALASFGDEGPVAGRWQARAMVIDVAHRPARASDMSERVTPLWNRALRTRDPEERLASQREVCALVDRIAVQARFRIADLTQACAALPGGG